MTTLQLTPNNEKPAPIPPVKGIFDRMLDSWSTVLAWGVIGLYAVNTLWGRVDTLSANRDLDTEARKSIERKLDELRKEQTDLRYEVGQLTIIIQRMDREQDRLRDKEPKRR